MQRGAKTWIKISNSEIKPDYPPVHDGRGEEVCRSSNTAGKQQQVGRRKQLAGDKTEKSKAAIHRE